MKSIAILASAAALAFAFTAPATFAETLSGSPVLILADHSMSSSKLIGTKVTDDKGASIGTVVDVLVKAAAVEPTVILAVGSYVGNGPKLVAVPLSHIKIDDRQAMMAGATKQMMASMPGFKFEGLSGGGG